MSDNQNFQVRGSPFTGHPLDPSTSTHFLKEATQASGSKDIGSNLEGRLALRIENQPFTENHVRNVPTSDVAVTDHHGIFNRESDYRHSLSNSMNHPYKEPRQSSDSKFIYTKPLEDMVSRFEKSDFICKEVHSTVFTKDVPTSESAKNVHTISDKEHLLQIRSAKDNFAGDQSSYGRNVDKQFKNEYLSNDQTTDMCKPLIYPSGGISEHLQKDDKILSNGQEESRIEYDLSSNRKRKDQCKTNITELEVAHQLLALSDGLQLQTRNPYIIDRKDKSFSSGRKEEQIKNDVLSSGKSEEHYIPDAPRIAKQLFAICETQVQYPDFVDKTDGSFSSRRKEEHIKNDVLSSEKCAGHYISNTPTTANQLYATTKTKETQVQYPDFIDKKYGSISSRRKEEHIKIDILSSGKSEEHYIPNAPTISKQLSAICETQVQYPDFVDKKYGSFSNRRKEERIKNDVLSNEKCAGHYIPNTPTTANQLYAISKTNETQVRYPEFKDHLSLDDSSSDYLKLYTKTQPENYDFAMNIMAYIEELNDSSWNATISYFDEYVKKICKYLWNKMEDFLKSKIELQTFDRTAFLDLMSDFTRSSKCRKYNLSGFLNYCVIMSQLGIIARKCHFEGAPIYIIFLLRDAIKEMEKSQSMLFEINVKKYAKDFVDVLKL